MVEIFTAIAEYGIVPAIICVVLYIIMTVLLKRMDAKAKIRENEREAKMLDFIKDIAGKNNCVHEHTPEEEEKNWKLDSFIIEQLEGMIKSGADRAFMMTFHNGVRDVLGRGFAKMSITQECINYNQRQIMQDYQNMPRILFPTLYKEINDDGNYYISNLDDIKETDVTTYNFLFDHGVKAAIFRAIKRQDGLLIGFLAAEFVEYTPEVFENAIALIEKNCYKITGALLSNIEGGTC